MFPSKEIMPDDIMSRLREIPGIEIKTCDLSGKPTTFVAIRDPDAFSAVSGLLYQNPDFRFFSDDLPLSSGRG